MGFVFRKSVKIAPGIRLNFSKRGFGISAGVPGARLSVSSKGRVTGSTGIPGTGMRYTESVNLKSKKRSKNNDAPEDNDYQVNGLNLKSREETFIYLEEFAMNKTKFFKYGGRSLIVLLLVATVSGLIGQGDFAGGVLAASWFLGVTLLFSYIRRVFRSRRNVSKKLDKSEEIKDS
jgi:hypothetical protein